MKGNFGLPKDGKDKEIRSIPGVSADMNLSLWNLKKLFENQIA
jgi:hypothetical protein